MKRLSLLAVSMLLTCTLFAADIFLRGSVNSWGAPDEFKFATSDDVVYTLEKSFDLFGEFKFAGADWTVGPIYGSGGGAVELETPLKLDAAGGNFECGSNSYKVTKIVLNLLENSATIYGEGGELEITSWTVCGSAAVFGTEFDAEDTSNDMEPVGGVYQLKKNGIALAADAIYEYKFVANHIWGIDDFPKGYNENITFEVETDGIYNITFSWNPATKAYSAIPTSVTPPIEFDSYIAIGDAALFIVDWTPSPIGVEYFTLETTDGIHYTKTVENVPIKTAGTFAYGFSKNGSTTEVLFADKSKTVTVDEAGAYNIAVSLTVAPGEEPKAEAILTKVDPGTTYYIAGNGADFAPDVDWCCGENWNEKGCPMESGFFTRDLPAGEYEFKITDGTGNNNWGYDAVDATQSTAGYTDNAGNIAFTLDKYSTVAVKFDGSKIILQWTAKDEPVPPVYDTWTLVGDMPPFPVAWTAIPAFDLTTTDGVVYTMTAEDVEMAVETFQYGFRKNHTEDFAPLEAKYTANLTDGTGNYKVEITIDFSATPVVPQVEFTKNPEPPVTGVTVNVEVPEGTPSCFFYGAFSGNSFVEMTKVDGIHYTINFPDKSPSDLDWGYKFCWESNNWDTQAEPETTYDITDGSMCVVLGWKTKPGTEYHYTTYTDWQVRTDWNGSWDPETWLTLTPNVDGTFSGLGEWGTGEGVNLASNDGPVKKNWYAANDPDITIEPGLAVGQEVRITLTVIDDENVKINVASKDAPSFDTWTLVGDMPPFPASWDATMAGFDLQTTDGVIYTMVADDVDMTVDKFQYGFRKNHTEDFAPLEAKYTANLTDGTGNYKVEITIDFSATPVVPQVEFTKNPEPPVTGVTVNVEVPEGTPSCFFYGAFSGNSFVEMTKVDGTHYTINFPDKSPSDLDWGYKFCWESNNWDTQAEPETTYDITDGSMCVVLGWKTKPGTEYHYTTYTDWQVRTDWNGSWDPETWLTLTPNVDGTFSGLGEWGTGEGVNLASNDGPVKKNWYAANDPDITIEPGLEVGTQVRFTLTVISDDNVNILVENANPTSADEAVEDSIYATSGTVYCSTPFEVYNLVGQNVTAQNGSLFGIYIVKTANTVKTVSVK